MQPQTLCFAINACRFCMSKVIVTRPVHHARDENLKKMGEVCSMIETSTFSTHLSLLKKPLILVAKR